jgi:hypothetical protein
LKPEGRLSQESWADAPGFAALWDFHPEEFYTIQMHGRPVNTPRYQQAYGTDDDYTGRTNVTLPMTPELQPVLR